MTFDSVKIKNGVNLHYINTSKFKTVNIGFFFHRPLRREEASLNALLASVLRRSCPMYPTSQSLAEAMDDYFGTSYDANVRKKGNNHIVVFNFSFPNEKFLKGEHNILNGVLDIAHSMILDQKDFREDYFKQEKDNLKLDITAEINDKRSYAQSRCIEEMCKNDPYGVNRLGDIKSIDAITKDQLLCYYKNELLTSPVDIFVCGDVDFDAVKTRMTSIFADYEVKTDVYPKTDIMKSADSIKSITDTEQIVQGKLSMGFTTGLEPDSPMHPALMIYNGILGSGAYSKLFNNVREKLSLCYYASSSMHYLKGMMLINSGIEVCNFQKAYDEILVQVEDMKKGNISSEEIEAAILGTVNNLRSMTDSAVVLEDFYLTNLMTGSALDIEQLIEQVKNVTKDDIVKVAQNVKLNTVYFLKGAKE